MRERKAQEPRRQSLPRPRLRGVERPGDEQQPGLGHRGQEFAQKGLTLLLQGPGSRPLVRGSRREVEQVDLVEKVRCGIVRRELGPQQRSGLPTPGAREKCREPSPGAEQRQPVRGEDRTGGSRSRGRPSSAPDWWRGRALTRVKPCADTPRSRYLAKSRSTYRDSPHCTSLASAGNMRRGCPPRGATPTSNGESAARCSRVPNSGLSHPHGPRALFGPT
jgi:hypothetical protein